MKPQAIRWFAGGPPCPGPTASAPALCTPPSAITCIERREIGATIRSPRSRLLASYAKRMLKRAGSTSRPSGCLASGRRRTRCGREGHRRPVRRRSEAALIQHKPAVLELGGCCSLLVSRRSSKCTFDFRRPLWDELRDVPDSDRRTRRSWQAPLYRPPLSHG